MMRSVSRISVAARKPQRWTATSGRRRSSSADKTRPEVAFHPVSSVAELVALTRERKGAEPRFLMMEEDDLRDPDEIAPDAETAGNSGLTYDPALDVYTIPWKTSKSWAGSCRTIEVTFTDGSYLAADVDFVK